MQGNSISSPFFSLSSIYVGTSYWLAALCTSSHIGLDSFKLNIIVADNIYACMHKISKSQQQKIIRLLTNRCNFWIFIILFTLGLSNTATAILEIFLAYRSNDISQR